MAHVKSFCSFVARIFVAQSMEEAFAAKYVLALSDSTGNGYAEYGSNVVKMSSSATKHVLILGLGASLIHASKGNRHMSILKKLLCTWAGIAESYYEMECRDQLLRKRVGLSVVPAREAVRVDQEGKFTPLHQARCDWRVESSSTIRSMENAWFEKDDMPLFTPRDIGSGLRFWGDRKKEIFNDLMERVARDCEPSSAELYIFVCAGWNLVPGPCVDAGKTYRKMAGLHAEQHLLKLLQTEAVTFRDALQMCYLWSDVPLTANLWSQLARCCSPLWWLSKRVIQQCGCSAEIFCPGFVRQSANDEEMLQFLQSRLSISGIEEALEDPYSIPALWRYMELYRSGGVYVSGSQSLGVELGLWLRDKQHELGIQMQWACWERAIGEKFEDWSAAAGVQSAFFGGRTTSAADGCRPLPARGADSVCPAPPIDGRAGTRRDPPGEVRSSHRAQHPRVPAG